MRVSNVSDGTEWRTFYEDTREKVAALWMVTACVYLSQCKLGDNVYVREAVNICAG